MVKTCANDGEYIFSNQCHKQLGLALTAPSSKIPFKCLSEYSLVNLFREIPICLNHCTKVQSTAPLNVNIKLGLCVMGYGAPSPDASIMRSGPKAVFI